MIDASGALFPFIYPGGLKPFTPHGGNPDVLRQSALWSQRTCGCEAALTLAKWNNVGSALFLTSMPM